MPSVAEQRMAFVIEQQATELIAVRADLAEADADRLVKQERLDEAVKHHAEHHESEGQDLTRTAAAEARIEELEQVVEAIRVLREFRDAYEAADRGEDGAFERFEAARAAARTEAMVEFRATREQDASKEQT